MILIRAFLQLFEKCDGVIVRIVYSGGGGNTLKLYSWE